MSQRDLAQAMGVSLGKANYCLKALMDKGLVKLESFRNNPDKRNYAYGIGKVFWESSRAPKKGAPRVMLHPQGVNLSWELN
jgi:DNA-binding Lrp family transcriptional regulator